MRPFYAIFYVGDGGTLYVDNGAHFVLVTDNESPDLYRKPNPASAKLNRLKRCITSEVNNPPNYRNSPYYLEIPGDWNTRVYIEDVSRLSVRPVALSVVES